MLTEALDLEKRAESNCGKILEGLTINGFRDEVAKIQNDEREHQELVGELLELLG